MKTKITIIWLLFMVTFVKAQEKIITGIVSDTLGSLPGVSITVKGTTKGTETDFDGKYSIKANVGDTITFKYLGYVSQNKKVEKETKILNIILKEDASVLDEIVVVGYGTTTRKSYTRAESKVFVRGASSFSGKVSGVEAKKISRIDKNLPQSGQLTAGEIDDLKKWKEWENMYKKDKELLKVKKDWKFSLDNKLEIKVNDYKDKPINNASVFLYDKFGNLVYKMKTDVFGQATFFRHNKDQYIVQVIYNDKIKGIKLLSNQNQASFKFQNTYNSKEIDIMFTVDATGSMADEINYLKSEVENIITRVDSSISKKRVGLTFYRDIGDTYIVKDFDFTTDILKVKQNLLKQNAGGGGDYEEAVEKALEVSISKSWNENARAKLLFLILDAPPHLTDENIKTLKAQIQKAKEKGIKIIPIVSSGADKTVEYLMRYFSIVTNGTYVFLTDDSGIGNPHIKPTTSSYKVEKLNDLIVRLIKKYSAV